MHAELFGALPLLESFSYTVIGREIEMVRKMEMAKEMAIGREMEGGGNGDIAELVEI
jgi:hypothetical protein